MEWSKCGCKNSELRIRYNIITNLIILLKFVYPICIKIFMK